MVIAMKRLMQLKNPVEETSYIVFTDGSRYYAKNGNTGMIEYSDTNAANVIQYVVNRVAERGGGKVFIRAGEYLINSTINLRSGVTIEGEGRNTRLIATGDFPVFRGVGTDTNRLLHVVDRDMEIVCGGKTNPNAHGIQLEFANEIRLYNLWLTRCREAIWVKDVYNNHYAHIFMLDNYIGFHAAFPSGASPINSFTMVDVVINNTDSFGAVLEGISGCKVFGLEVLRAGRATVSDGILIKGGEWNEFVACLSDLNTGNGWYLTKNVAPWDRLRGIRLISPWAGSNGFSGIVLDEVMQVTIVGGDIRSNKFAGIVVKDSSNIIINGVKVVDNSKVGDGQASGILVRGTSNRVWITSCHVIGPHKYAIEEYENPNDNLIAFNDLEGFVTGAIMKLGDKTVVIFNKNYDTENFKATNVSVPIGTANTYGSPATITSPSGRITFFRLKITWGGTFGTGETVTVKVEAVYSDNSTAYIEKSATATGSLWLSDDDVLSLIAQSKNIVKLNIYAKTSASSTSVTVTVDIYGKG